jgi:tetratricopeptide (TPR) repeat protein
MLHASSNSNELIEKIIQCHQMAGQTKKALNWVNRGLTKNETHNLLMMKGNLLYELKRYNEAISVFEAATGKKSRDPGRPWLMIGYSAWLNDELEKAKGAFEKAAGYKKHKKDAEVNIERIDRIIKSKS